MGLAPLAVAGCLAAAAAVTGAVLYQKSKQAIKDHVEPPTKIDVQKAEKTINNAQDQYKTGMYVTAKVEIHHITRLSSQIDLNKTDRENADKALQDILK